MKRSLWLSVGVGLLLVVALVPTSCIKPRPGQPPAPTKQAIGATATRQAAELIPTATALAPLVVDTPTEALPTATPEPADVVVEPTEQATAAAPTGGEATAAETSYEVRWGDTLSQIAQRFGTTVAAILARNTRITNRNQIFAGTVLVIPGTGSSTGQTEVARETGVYTVQQGDTIANIAHRFGLTIAALLQANPAVTNMNVIHTGQSLVLPTGGDYVAPTTYVVRAGDTLASVARRFNTTIWAIRVRNNLGSSNLIYVGQVLTIP